MSEFHTNNPKLYEDLGLQDLLRDEPLDESQKTGDYANRVIDSDRILSIRRGETGEFQVIPISINGAEMIVTGTRKAMDAYFHPNITPGLESEDHEDTYWDRALDALNGLEGIDKAWAIKDLEKMRAHGLVPPTLVFDIVKRHRPRQLRKAA